MTAFIIWFIAGFIGSIPIVYWEGQREKYFTLDDYGLIFICTMFGWVTLFGAFAVWIVVCIVKLWQKHTPRFPRIRNPFWRGDW